MYSLEDFGFDAVRYAETLTTKESEEIIGRVVLVERGHHLVVTEHGMVWRKWSGRQHWATKSAAERPTVGDWVLGRDARTTRVLPRVTTLARQSAGTRSGEQMIATNVDKVFVVTAVGGDFSPNRLQRYVTLVRAGGAHPVIVLNKTDQPFDVIDTMRSVDEAAPNVPLCLISARDHHLEDLAPHMIARTTIALVGSSGVGKSTLLNRLVGQNRQMTEAVRQSDETGRHTTTRRELVRLPNDVLLIDTPGLREVGLVGEANAVDATFDDVASFADNCHFADCQHTNEPGCAVQAALGDGLLSASRWASYQQLRREAEYEARRASARVRLDTKTRWKQIHKGLRARKKLDPKLR